MDKPINARLEYTIRTPPFSRGMLYNRIFLRLIVLFKKMKLFDFMRMFYNPSTIVTTLRDHGLLRHDMPCPNCGDRMHERSYNNSDRLMFFCDKRTCRRKKTIRSSSFFENSRLALCDSMLFLHLWSRNYSEQLIIDDFSFCKKTVVDWSRFCRDLCVLDFESDTTLIGGPGCVVEIDETMAVKRKYNRGRMLNAGWLFGGIERRNDSVFRCFMCLVYDRSEAHLTHIIRQHVAPGTRIMTDGWSAYRNLGSMGYLHNVVIHEDNFVAPDDPSIHTQRIEATWCSLKRFIRAHGTNKGSYYLEYICEYLFRRKHSDVFDALLRVIRQKYNLL